MKRRRASVSIVLTAALLAACTAGSAPPSPSDVTAGVMAGGTLQVGAVDPHAFAWDPQVNALNSNAWELSRCCLARTLLSYAAGTTEEGGTVLRPDLATALPTVSPDGLVWTFDLQPGLRYGPPLQEVEITSADVVRSLERELDPGVTGPIQNSYFPSLFTPVIDGAAAYAAGEASTISGLETPDPHTLRVRLAHPFSDFAYLMALPVTAPVPPDPARPAARYGAAKGHHGDGFGFLISSGPYMIEGNDSIDPSGGTAAPGLSKDTVTLVRNPSWVRTTDQLRPAFADTIVIHRIPARHAIRRVRSGSLDVLLDQGPTHDEMAADRADPALSDRLAIVPRDAILYASLNLAIPPFDDVHVRRAVAAAIDRSALAQAMTPEESAVPLYHLGIDSLEGNTLANFRPSWASGSASASAEMRLSGYDRNHDGRCDVPSCQHILTLAPAFLLDRERAAQAIARQLRSIGVYLDVQGSDAVRFFSNDPAAHVPVRLMNGFVKDYPGPASMLPPLLSTEGIGAHGCCNAALAGASQQQLRSFGYAGSPDPPTFDARIAECRGLFFDAASRCWADLDQYATDQVLPYVPLLTLLTARTFSARVRRFAMDQSQSIPWPALDAIAIGGTEASASGSSAGGVTAPSP